MNPLAVITGGSKGIGKALVRRFAQAGFDIITCARDAQALAALQKEVEAEFSVKVDTFVVDLADKATIEAFAQEVLALERPISALINNAGFFQPSYLHNESDALFEQTMAVNVFGVYYLSKALLPAMIGLGQGYLFNICSIASQTILPQCGAYGVSKFALYGMTKILRQELKTMGIRVTAVLPGATFTASWDGVEVAPERLMAAQDVAESVWAAYQLPANTLVEEITLRPLLGDL
jgi:short-subunit dehydrogenase